MKNKGKKFKLLSGCVYQTRKHRKNHMVNTMKTDTFFSPEDWNICQINERINEKWTLSSEELLKSWKPVNSCSIEHLSKNSALHLLKHAELELFLLHSLQSYVNKARCSL